MSIILFQPLAFPHGGLSLRQFCFQKRPPCLLCSSASPQCCSPEGFLKPHLLSACFSSNFHANCHLERWMPAGALSSVSTSSCLTQLSTSVLLSTVTPFSASQRGRGLCLSCLRIFIHRSFRGGTEGLGSDVVSAAALVSASAWVPSLAWCSGLRIWHCCCCGVVCGCGLDLIPRPGTSICLSCGQKKTKTKTKKEKKNPLHSLRMSFPAPAPSLSEHHLSFSSLPLHHCSLPLSCPILGPA